MHEQPSRVLIADDEPHVRLYFSHILRKVGFEVIDQAANGAEAVEKFQSANNSYRAVFLDVSMPVMDGLQALRAIKAASSPTIVIMLTSLANRATVSEAVRSGADFYLRKDETAEGCEQQIKGLVKRFHLLASPAL